MVFGGIPIEVNGDFQWTSITPLGYGHSARDARMARSKPFNQAGHSAREETTFFSFAPDRRVTDRSGDSRACDPALCPRLSLMLQLKLSIDTDLMRYIVTCQKSERSFVFLD
ncbi:hypothetical protein FKM82_001078 [Ascaphus truei]